MSLIRGQSAISATRPQPVVTRLRAFVSDPVLRAAVGQVRAPLQLSEVVERQQILLVDLPERELGSETAMLLGSLFVARLRATLALQAGKQPCYVYVPECQRINPLLSARLLSVPPFAGGVLLSADQIGAYPPKVRAAMLAAETLLAFRLGPDDVRYVSPRFDLAQVETALLTLPADRLAASHHQYELQAIAPRLVRYGQRAMIERRSRDIMAAPRGTVERRIERFLLGEETR